MLSREGVLRILESVKDPEVPVLSIVELGVVRDVEILEDRVKVSITPTYSGCPALQVMRDGVRKALESEGIGRVDVTTVMSPPWTTDWMTEPARRKLKEFGIAPPSLSADGGQDANIPCPFCDSTSTELRSAFGSTACKSLFVCRDCLQPFEHFKCI